jgi:hypothetical protein
MRASTIRGAAIAVSFVLFAATPATAQANPATASSSPLMRWKLALDLRTRPNRNPFPSYLGGPAVWSLRESRSPLRDGNYGLLPTYSSTFGSAGISAWHANTKNCVPLPAIGVNTTNTSVPLCAGHVPGGAAFVQPSATHMAVVAWTSPFDGAVAISHDAIAELDGSCSDGVSYYVDLGTSQQLATTTIAKGSGTVLPPITQQIEPGQSLYFIVDPGPNGNVGCDTTQLQITIDQITPNGEPEAVATP